MRKICAVLISTLLVLTAVQVSAYTYSGAWNVNDLNAGDFFALTVASAGGTAVLSLYDNDPNNSFAILDNDNPSVIPTVWYGMGLNQVTVYIFDNAGNWYANFEKDNLTGAFALGATPEFKFMFSDANITNLTVYDVDYSGSDSYVLAATDTTDPPRIRPVMTVIVSDVTPVPIPGAILLLGSGLIGLISIRRRPRRS